MLPSADRFSPQSHRHQDARSNRGKGGMHLCLTLSSFPAWILRKTRFVSNNKPEGQIEVGRTQSCNFQPRCGFYPSPFSLQAYSRFTNN